MNDKYKDYLESKEWADMKLDLFAIRGKKCERCGSENNIQVHHKTYERLYNEEPGDLEILCGGCHLEEHGMIGKRAFEIQIFPYWFISNTRKPIDGITVFETFDEAKKELIIEVQACIKTLTKELPHIISFKEKFITPNTKKSNRSDVFNRMRMYGSEFRKKYIKP